MSVTTAEGGVSGAAECCDDCTIERGGGLGGLMVGRLLEVSDVICDGRERPDSPVSSRLPSLPLSQQYDTHPHYQQHNKG